MNKLVFVKDQKVVTDSLTVAETFGKRHDRVLQDIRELDCSPEFSLHHFVESTWTSERGRQYPLIIMSEQGFTVLAMGYTGKNAMQFKEDYVNEFHRMRDEIQSNVKVLNPEEQLMASMKLTIETNEKTKHLETKMVDHEKQLVILNHKLDQQITLTSGEQRAFQKAVARKVYTFTQEKDEASRLYRELYREIKDRFAVASYKDVKKHELQSAMNYVNNWIPRQVS